MERLIDATPIEEELFKLADKALAKNPYEKARICAFRGAFEMVSSAPTVSQPPNAPLTLEELREMDGEPVWCIDGNGYCCWCLVNCDNGFPCCMDNCTGLWDCCYYGMKGDGKYGLSAGGWLAYRRKPEEVEPSEDV